MEVNEEYILKEAKSNFMDYPRVLGNLKLKLVATFNAMITIKGQWYAY